jgi:hypothetical protein
LPDAFGAERGSFIASVRTAVNFTDDVYVIVDAEDACEPIKQHIVLAEVSKRGIHDPEPDISVNVRNRGLAGFKPELFLNDDLAEYIYLIGADTA